MMHYRWLAGGADGAVVGFHFCVDDGVILQFIPVNEVSWQAADGDGPGNFSSVSCELCVNKDGNEAKARHNAEALAAGVSVALGIPVTRVKRHWDFNAGTADRHHCPDHMMNSGYWPTFVANVGALMNGPIVEPPLVTPPVAWTWLSKGDPDYGKDHTVGNTEIIYAPATFTTQKDTPRLTTGNKKGPRAGDMITLGLSFESSYVFRSKTDNLTYRITDESKSRVLASDLLPKDQVTVNGTVSRRTAKGGKPTVIRKAKKKAA
jgi:hypothetical protein